MLHIYIMSVAELLLAMSHLLESHSIYLPFPFTSIPTKYQLPQLPSFDFASYVQVMIEDL